MGAFELNDGLRQHLVKPGDPGRNQTGNNGQETRLAYREFAKLLRAKGEQPCPYEGYEGLTYREALVERIYYDAIVKGKSVAQNNIVLHVDGRVPYVMDITKQETTTVDVNASIDLSALTDAELADFALQRALQTKAEIAEERRRRALEATPIEEPNTEQTELGSGPVGAEPTEPVSD